MSSPAQNHRDWWASEHERYRDWETARSRARWRALALAEAVALLACLVVLA